MSEVLSSLQDPLVLAASEWNGQVLLLFNERPIYKDVNVEQDVFHALICLDLFECVATPEPLVFAWELLFDLFRKSNDSLSVVRQLGQWLTT